MIERVVIGLIASGIISTLGWRARALTRSGAIAALIVGTVTIVGASWRGAVILGAFFVTSSALSRIARPQSAAAKGSTRDGRQVLANGGVAGLMALSGLWMESHIAVVLLSGALAAATADTWATEVGSRSRRQPRLVVSRRPVQRGVSGGVTPLGTSASVCGAMVIGVLSGVTLLTTVELRDAVVASVIVTGAGVFGSLLDSLLGELAQERRFCPVCDEPTESPVHRCGTMTTHVGGVEGFDNDMVNLACTAGGSGIAGLFIILVL